MREFDIIQQYLVPLTRALPGVDSLFCQPGLSLPEGASGTDAAGHEPAVNIYDSNGQIRETLQSGWRHF